MAPSTTPPSIWSSLHSSSGSSASGLSASSSSIVILSPPSSPLLPFQTLCGGDSASAAGVLLASTLKPGEASLDSAADSTASAAAPAAPTAPSAGDQPSSSPAPPSAAVYDLVLPDAHELLSSLSLPPSTPYLLDIPLLPDTCPTLESLSPLVQSLTHFLEQHLKIPLPPFPPAPSSSPAAFSPKLPPLLLVLSFDPATFKTSYVGRQTLAAVSATLRHYSAQLAADLLLLPLDAPASAPGQPRLLRECAAHRLSPPASAAASAPPPSDPSAPPELLFSPAGSASAEDLSLSRAAASATNLWDASSQDWDGVAAAVSAQPFGKAWAPPPAGEGKAERERKTAEIRGYAWMGKLQEGMEVDTKDSEKAAKAAAKKTPEKKGGADVSSFFEDLLNK